MTVAARSKLDLLGEAFGVSRQSASRSRSTSTSQRSLDTDTVELESQRALSEVPVPRKPKNGRILALCMQGQDGQAVVNLPAKSQGDTTIQDLPVNQAMPRELTQDELQRLAAQIGQKTHGCDRCTSRLGTTVMIEKHICANCSRLRSRKYHADNPIVPGTLPVASFCRRCQRDASSTSSSHSHHGRSGWQRRRTRSKKHSARASQSVRPYCDIILTCLSYPLPPGIRQRLHFR